MITVTGIFDLTDVKKLADNQDGSPGVTLTLLISIGLINHNVS